MSTSPERARHRSGVAADRIAALVRKIGVAIGNQQIRPRIVRSRLARPGRRSTRG
jgi:hypothetical protein